MIEALSSPFVQRSLCAVLVASIACGLIGPFVVVKRASAMSGGIAHAALGGVGIAYFLGWSPIVGAAIVAIISALIISHQYLTARQSLDTLISVVWSVGMALGVLLISLSPGYPPDLANFLFGSVVYIPQSYLIISAALVGLIFLIIYRYFHFFQAITFDEDFARSRGVSLAVYYTAMMVLTSLAVVILIRVVGIILTIALLTIPAVIAQRWTKGLIQMMFVATAITLISSLVGFFISYYASIYNDANLPSGPLIVLFVGFLYCCSSLIKVR